MVIEELALGVYICVILDAIKADKEVFTGRYTIKHGIGVILLIAAVSVFRWSML